MKNITLKFSAIILVVFMTISCKKDYNCECKWYESGKEFYNKTYILKTKKSKSEAKDSCADKEDYVTGAPDLLIVGECVLK